MSDSRWFFADASGCVYGPNSLDQMVTWLAMGRIDRNWLVIGEGDEAWAPAGTSVLSAIKAPWIPPALNTIGGSTSKPPLADGPILHGVATVPKSTGIGNKMAAGLGFGAGLAVGAVGATLLDGETTEQSSGLSNGSQSGSGRSFIVRDRNYDGRIDAIGLDAAGKEGRNLRHGCLYSGSEKTYRKEANVQRDKRPTWLALRPDKAASGVKKTEFRSHYPLN